MITVFSNNKQIPVNKVEFSDGAITYKLDELQPDADYISINVDPSTKVSLIREELLILTECISSLVDEDYFTYNVKMILNLPYLAYGRADRVFEKGNPNALLNFLIHSPHLNMNT